MVHATAVAGLAGVFAYQGLVPKLWKLDGGEVAIWRNLGLSEPGAELAVRTAGAVETAFAAVTIARSNERWPFAIAIAAMPALAFGAGTGDRRVLTKAFNPASLGIAVVALGTIALLTTERRTQRRSPAPRAAPAATGGWGAPGASGSRDRGASRTRR